MVQSAIVVASDWQSMKDQASVMVRSGLLPRAVDTPEKAIVIMMQGRELGIGAMQALGGINVIQGKPTVSPQLMLALINRSGHLEDMSIEDDGNTCTVTMKRVGRSPHTETFSMADAGAMALAGKDNWKKQPAVMRKWRAISACARVVFSDVISGMYTSEEINPDATIDAETGEIVDVAPSPTMRDMADSTLVTVDDIERIDAGGPVNEPHWTETQNWKRFYAYASGLNLTHDEVHEALEVESAKQFPGTKAEAMHRLQEYAAVKAEALQSEQGNGQNTLDAFFDAPEHGQNAIDAIRGA